MNKTIGIMLLSLVLVFTAVGCGAQGSGGDTLRIAAQTWTEPKVIAQMHKLLIEDRTDIPVTVIPDLSFSPVVISAMEQNEVDMASVLYSGEIFNGYFDIEDTKDRQEVMKQAQAGFDQHYGFHWFDGYGFQNTYAFTVRSDVAKERNLKTISDVAAIAGELRFGVDTTWMERDNDGYRAFQNAYGFKFGREFPMEVGLMYEAVANQEVDIVLAYTTDSRIKEFDLVTLEDDKQFFPPYDASPVIRKDVLEKHPELNEVISLLIGKIDEETMVGLNYEVDINKRSEEEVAKEYLQSIGLLQ